MTTNADPTPAPSEPITNDNAEIWRATGRLEGTAAALLEGQRELKDGQRDLRIDMDTGFREMNRRVDRLFYTVPAASASLLVAMFASRFVGS